MTTKSDLLTLSPDHLIMMDGSSTDEGVGSEAPKTLTIQNSGDHSGPACCRDVTNSFQPTASDGRLEMADSNDINTSNQTQRTMGGWIRTPSGFNSISQTIGIYKEGGSAGNFAIVAFPGGGLLFQALDPSDFEIQSFPSVTLKADRSYHVLFRFDGNGGTNRFDAFVDGIKSTVSNPDPPAPNANNMDQHGGDINWGDPDVSLNIGGNGTGFSALDNCGYNAWFSTRTVESDTTIREFIFERQALPTTTISADTVAAMQTALDALSGTTRVDSALAIAIEQATDATDFSLTVTNILFDPGCSIEIQFTGTANTLTLNQSGTTSLDTSKGSAPFGGTLVINTPPIAVTISPLVSGSRLKIYDTGTTTLVDGVNSSSTSFSFATGVATQGYDIYIVNPGQESVFIENYIFPSSSTTLPISQVADINYSATGSSYDLSLDGTGLGTTADLWLDTANLEYQLATGNNLSQPTGIPLQDLYSRIIEARYANDSLMSYHDPVVAISATAGEFEYRRGWTHKNTTTRDLLRSGGVAQYSAAGALEAEWLCLEGLLNLASSATPYYWFGSATNPTIVDTLNAGNLNQLVQIYGDASNGNFDLRSSTELTISVRAQGENTVTYALKSEQSLTELSPQRYFIPLTTTANVNITVADSAIDSNSDGAADQSPYDGMSLTYLDGTGFTAWADSTVYAANAVVLDGGRWYVTAAGGTSSGTGVGDDAGVTDWAAYSGERQIDGTYRAFNIIYAANGGSLAQMTAYAFWVNRQDVDIDAGSADRTGRAVDPIAATQGSTLLMATGVVVDNFASSAQLLHIPVDVNGVERPYPAPEPTLSLTGFPAGSTVSIAQAGITLDLLNNATSPYEYIVGSGGESGDIYTFKVVAAGKQDFFVTIDSSETTSAPYLGLDEASEQTLSKPSLDFRELMDADAAFTRIAGTDTTLNSQLWEVSSWQSEWNTAVVADSPTTGEISVWVGYLSTTSYTNISFNSNTGEVS